MSDSQSAREKLKELASELNIDVDDLVQNSLSADVPVAPPPPADIPLSDAAIRAAICDSYTVRESWAADLDRSILERSQLIMVDGRRRLRLSESARGSILQKAASTQADRLRALLDEAPAPGTGHAALPATQAATQSLHSILKGQTLNLSGAPPAELRAAVTALDRLREAPLPAGTPSLAEAQRLLERAELLEPLRIMVGATGSWDTRPEGDRFAGRGAQIAQLRAFVDEIDSEGTGETIQRGVQAAQRAVRRQLGDRRAEGVRLIVARGGLGKSALIAKFVLDHAMWKSRPFPFAYLDFDRASIQARDPRQLLLEVVRQVALQFPQAAAELAELRDQIKQSMTGTSPRRTLSADPFDQFRTIMRNRVTFGTRALLIVLDTVEIAQCDATAMKGLVQFLDRMSQGGFTELRIVAAGRAPVPDLVAESRVRRAGVVMTLPPLSLDEATDMVQRLGKSLLPGAWRDVWTSRLAGHKNDPPERREPLSLRVAVETLRDEAPDQRDAQSLTIEKLGEDGADNFVGKLYMNRVVGHVTGGEDVRKLAWPGLVMRRITPDIIRHALAPVLKINPDSADTLFESLATQLWIVSRDGNVLTHQPDLRARTLPLMRKKEEFERVNAAAIAYYGERHEASAQHRAEWLYHRLLAREAPHKVDRDWNDSLVPFLKEAASDFPAGGPEADYLAVRTADHLQSNEVLNRVEPRLALLHISRVGSSKGSLEDRSLDPVLLTLPLDAIRASTLPREAEAALFTLAVKTGRWRFGAGTMSDYGAWHVLAAVAHAYRDARTIKSEAPARAEERERKYVTDSQIATVAALIQGLATARLDRWRGAERLDELVSNQLNSGSTTSDLTVRTAALRTAMVFGYRSTAIAAQLWCTQATELLRAGATGAVSSQELTALLPDEDLERVARHVLTAAGQKWEVFVEQTNQATDRTRLNDPELAAAVIDAVIRRAERAEPADLDRLRRFAAARDEDWIVPLAYAAYRATNGKIPSSMAALFSTHYPRELTFLERRVLKREPVPADVMLVLRMADEASDLESAAELFLKDGDPTNAADLRQLLTLYRGWKTGMREILEA